LKDRNPLPHNRVRLAIFWILILTWPTFRVTEHFWQPGWYTDAEDVAAALTVMAFLLGKLLFYDTQRAVCERLEQVERKVEGYDEAWDLLAPLDDGPSRSSR